MNTLGSDDVGLSVDLAYKVNIRLNVVLCCVSVLWHVVYRCSYIVVVSWGRQQAENIEVSTY